MPNLKEKIDKLVDDFTKAVVEVSKDVEEKDSKAYKNFMNYDNSYFSNTDSKSYENKVDFPKENEFMYFVKGYGDKKSQVFTNLDEAKAYAIEKNKFLFEINGSDFYKNPIDLKSLKQIDLTKDLQAVSDKFYVIESIWSNYNLKENIVFVGNKKECCEVENNFRNNLLKKSKSGEVLCTQNYYTVSEKQWNRYNDKPKKESVLGKIADYKKEEKGIFKPKAEKNKDIGVEI